MDAIIAQGSKAGFGNRVFILASNQVLAERCGRPLHISWVPNEHCPGKFTDVFCTPENVSLSDTPLEGPAVIRSDGWNPVDYWSRYKDRLACSRDQFLREVRRAIRQLQWSPFLVEQSRHGLRSYNVDWRTCVGVHWRGTDRLRQLRKNVWQFDGGVRVSLKRFPIAARLAHRCLSVEVMQRLMLARIRRQINAASRTARTFFVASDDLDVGEMLQQHVRSLGCKSIHFDHQREPAVRRQTSLLASGQDMWALDQCRALIASDFTSSFVAMVAIRSGRHPINGLTRFITEVYGDSLQAAPDEGHSTLAMT